MTDVLFFGCAAVPFLAGTLKIIEKYRFIN